jgi:hypothetical protein
LQLGHIPHLVHRVASARPRRARPASQRPVVLLAAARPAVAPPKEDGGGATVRRRQVVDRHRVPERVGQPAQPRRPRPRQLSGDEHDTAEAAGCEGLGEHVCEQLLAPALRGEDDVRCVGKPERPHVAEENVKGARRGGRLADDSVAERDGVAMTALVDLDAVNHAGVGVQAQEGGQAAKPGANVVKDAALVDRDLGWPPPEQLF